MSYNIFIISDTHFSHENMYQFFDVYYAESCTL